MLRTGRKTLRQPELPDGSTGYLGSDHAGQLEEFSDDSIRGHKSFRDGQGQRFKVAIINGRFSLGTGTGTGTHKGTGKISTQKKISEDYKLAPALSLSLVHTKAQAGESGLTGNTYTMGSRHKNLRKRQKETKPGDC